MPSKISKFQFRGSKIRVKLFAKGIDPDHYAKALIKHGEDFIDKDICPICKKSLSECQYLNRIVNKEES